MLVAAALGLAVWYEGAARSDVTLVATDVALVVIVRAAGLLAAGACRGGRSRNGLARMNRAPQPAGRPGSRPRPRPPSLPAVLTAGIVGAATGLTVTVLAPIGSARLAFIVHDSGVSMLLPVATTSAGLFACLDVALAAEGRRVAVATRQCVTAALRLIGLTLALGSGTPHALFVAWVAPLALLAGPCLGYLILRRPIGPPDPPSGSEPADRVSRPVTAGPLIVSSGAVLLVLAAFDRRGAFTGAGFGLAVLAAATATELGRSLITVNGGTDRTGGTGGRGSPASPSASVTAVLAAGGALGAMAAPFMILPLGTGYVAATCTPLRVLLIAVSIHLVAGSIRSRPTTHPPLRLRVQYTSPGVIFRRDQPPVSAG